MWPSHRLQLTKHCSSTAPRAAVPAGIGDRKVFVEKMEEIGEHVAPSEAAASLEQVWGRSMACGRMGAVPRGCHPRAHSVLSAGAGGG